VPTLSPALESEHGYATNSVGTSGYPWDASEPAPELSWPLSVQVYDRMRRSDAQTAAVLRAITLPIRRAPWRVDPNGAKDEVVALVAEDLGLPVLGAEENTKPSGRVRGRFSWDEHLRLALLMLAYGHAPFEQVYRIEGGRARLRKLAWRAPTSIAKINVARDGGLEGIEQYAAGFPGNAKPVPIPVDRLVMYVLDREGGNWQGLSILRSAYKHWLLKDRLLRVDAMTKERNGMGVPVAEAAQGSTPADLSRLEDIATKYRAGESSGAALPYGSRLRLLGVEGTLPDILASVRYHDEAIAGNVLAQFLKLGTTQTGSRALGESMTDFFQMALDAVSGEIAAVATCHVVEDLVDLNFGADEAAPKLKVETAKAELDLAAAELAQLVSTGVLTADDGLEGHTRDRYRLPAREEPRPEPEAAPEVQPPPAPVVQLPVAAAKGTKEPPAAYTLVDQRRAALERKHRKTVAKALKALAGEVDAAAVVDAALAAGLPQAGPGGTALLAADGPDDRDPIVEETAAQTAGTALGGAAASGRYLRLVVQDAIEDAGAKGIVVAMLLLAQARGEDGPDEDIAGRAAMADLADVLGTGTTAADRWVSEQLGVLARAVGLEVARGVQAGKTRDQLLATVRGVVGDTRRSEALLDHAIAQGLTRGSLATYQAEGVTYVDFLTALDGKVDEECIALAGDNPYTLGSVPEPPQHVNCRCTVAPRPDVATTPGPVAARGRS
jgi:hypothetical protein